MTPKTPKPDSNESQGGVLLALAARCEVATGADRELDARIWCEVGNDLGYDDPPQRHRLMRPLQPRICIMGRWLGSALDKYPEDIEGVAYNWRVPKFTTSLDAALTLVPAGMQWNYDSHYGMARIFHYWDGHEGPECSEYGAEGSTPALALTAASLRARSLSGEGGRA
jgi:hypothetical protein